MPILREERCMLKVGGVVRWQKGDNRAIHNCLSTFHVETALKLNGATKP